MLLLVGTVGGGQSIVDVSWEMVNGSPGYSCHTVHRASRRVLITEAWRSGRKTSLSNGPAAPRWPQPFSLLLWTPTRGWAGGPRGDLSTGSTHHVLCGEKDENKGTGPRNSSLGGRGM